MSHDFADAIAFIQVVQHGGYTAAARAAGTSKARLSRQVAQLERRIGAPLLKRSTRRLGLTEAGRMYFEACTPLFAELAECEARVTDLVAKPQGRIVVTAPAWFAAQVLAPMLVEHRAAHPGFHPEVIATHAPLDLISEEVDLAFRLWIGDLPDSKLTVRRLASLPQRVFAGPRHLAVYGAPCGPEELSNHPALVTHVRQPAERERWWLTDGAKGADYPIEAVAVASDPAVLEAMMTTGEGLLLATDLQMQAALARGAAIPVLPGWRGRPVNLYAALPAGRRSPRKVRLLLEHVAAALTPLLAD
jgi:LysR family transcriptional regulator, regulator for bpeEF and oprC